MKIRVKRLIAQLGFLGGANLGALGIKTGFCYPFFYCHACPYAVAGCPLGIIEHGVYKGKIMFQLLLFPLLTITAISLVVGRAACGWACPIGLLQRGTAKVANKLKNANLAEKLGKNRIDSYLRYTKYAILIVLGILTTALIGFMFTDICPVGFLTGTLPILAANPDGFTPNSFFPIALIIFLLFIILIFTIGRGWCKYFCPVGAMMAPFNKVSLLEVKVNEDLCTHCNACINVCPMGINVPEMKRSTECIFCGKCIEACPKNAISYKIGGLKWKKVSL
jgi:polyferredoxin